MCSRYAETQCCVCLRYLDQSNNRIIVEICGHQKCRECFIKEEDGCSMCVQNKEKFPIENQWNSHRNSFEIISSCSESVTISVDKGATAIEIPPVIDINEDVSHIITTNENGNGVRYKCTICQKSFKSRNNRKYHLFCDKTRSKPFQCNQCDKQFITLAHMNYHQNTHNTDKHFTCSYCQKNYSGSIALRKHMKKHQNEFKYKCSQCDEKFLYKEQLNIHQNRHNNIFHKCPKCEKRFLVKSNWTKHIQSHFGQNRKICAICQNSFSGNSALKTHMLTHSKAKPHQCEKCSKKFIDQRTLERHWKTHMENAFYECILCPAKSGRKDNIRRHVRNLHSESDNELSQILEKIFANFEKKKNSDKSIVIRKEKADESKAVKDKHETVNETICVQELNKIIKSVEEPIKPACVVRNNATSVIKFAGRSQVVQSIRKEEKAIAKPIENPVIEFEPDPEPVEVEQEQISPTIDLDPIAEIGVKLPSLEDTLPDIAPLPLIKTNTNLTVYRQLLSPYLRKHHSINENSNTKPVETKGCPKKIDRPLKKMIDKYDNYHN